VDDSWRYPVGMMVLMIAERVRAVTSREGKMLIAV
jgi:hypothetical protein